MRVLVVEDEPTLYEALRTGLGAEGFTVDVRTDGLSGLDAARTAEYAVIVLDVMLPE